MISSKIFGLADPRTYGSGNPGTRQRAAATRRPHCSLIGDALKGTLAVVVAKQMGLDDTIATSPRRLSRPPLPGLPRLQGGKGVATAAGVLFALDLTGRCRYWHLAAGGLCLALLLIAALVAAAAAPLFAALMHGATNQTIVNSAFLAWR